MATNQEEPFLYFGILIGADMLSDCAWVGNWGWVEGEVERLKRKKESWEESFEFKICVESFSRQSHRK